MHEEPALSELRHPLQALVDCVVHGLCKLKLLGFCGGHLSDLALQLPHFGGDTRAHLDQGARRVSVVQGALSCAVDKENGVI